MEKRVDNILWDEYIPARVVVKGARDFSRFHRPIEDHYTFKCHTGYYFYVGYYLKKQIEEIESSIWYAIREDLTT
jgi:hypothetical protein